MISTPYNEEHILSRPPLNPFGQAKYLLASPNNVRTLQLVGDKVGASTDGDGHDAEKRVDLS